MQHKEGIFKTSNGLFLFEQRWYPTAPPKAVIIIVHGYGEHSSRYIHVAEYLIHCGYCVYTFDLRGHGRSEGKRAFVWSFEEYISDLDSFLSQVRRYEKEKPIFILGHSLGGTIVVLFAITRKPDVRGLVLSGPLLKFSDDISVMFQNFVLIVGGIFPKLPFVKKLNSIYLSRDPVIVARYDSDPLVYHGRMFGKEAVEILKALKRIQAQMESVTLPLMILQGGADKLVDAEGSRQLYSRSTSKDKTLKLYEGLYHEILNEPEKEKILTDIVAWLDAHMI